MRKIEEAMCEAVKTRTNWESGNTKVSCGNFVKVYLHDNLIYRESVKEGFKEFTLAGWDTNTTRNRLRALDVDVCHVGGVPVYKGEQISDERWYNV